MPQITLPDGKPLEVPAGTRLTDVVARLAPPLAARTVAARVGDRSVDLTGVIEGDAPATLLTVDDPAGLDIFRHSSAHLLAEAVVSLFPDARPTIGPAVEEGFYYDFAHPPFSPEDLERIEARMREIAAEGRPLQRRVVSRDEALEIFRDNPYKLEMIREMPPEEPISVYDQGGRYVDLCRGPHVPDLNRIRAVKLLKLAGAYWRGDSRNVMLQRIYGISFADPAELKQYLKDMEEAARRDHRKLGRDLDLFSFHEEGQGFPFWHDRGAILYHELSDYIRSECRRRGYVEIRTPMVLNEQLWRLSGHWDHYADAMYFVEIEGKPHAIKPMNCPGGLLVYKNRRRSYRELPVRQAELGLVHRNELSGVLHGLFRVRAFTQDDAHVFCTEEQLNDEVVKLIQFCIDVYRTFGFPDPEIKLSTQPTDHIGDEAIWALATRALEAGLAAAGMPYKVAPGEGAFYGPKIDFDIRDSLRRRWQCGTVQVDFSMPERFDLTYEGPDGKPHRPVMLHRAILGSLERFIGILLEETAGKLPLWLSPVQARLIPVAEPYGPYAREVRDRMIEAGLRVDIDAREESLGKRVRAAQMEQVNYILVAGEREVAAGTVTVRTRDNVVHGPAAVAEQIARMQEEVRTRART